MKNKPAPTHQSHSVRQWLVAVLWLLGIAAAAMLGAWLMSSCVSVQGADGKPRLALGIDPALVGAAADSGFLDLLPAPVKWLIGLATAYAATPKGRDAIGAAVDPETPMLERPVAIASPLVPFLHSPKSVKRKEAERKATKASKKSVPPCDPVVPLSLNIPAPHPRQEIIAGRPE